MRAKLPDREGFVSRDGVKLAFEVYGDGADTMLFIPPWSIVHSRIYKAQLPYFSERFRCIAYDGRGNGKSDRPDRRRRLHAGQLSRRRPRGHGRPRRKASHRCRIIVWWPARLHSRGTPSRTRQGRRPRRNGLHDRTCAAHRFPPLTLWPNATVRRLGQIQPSNIGCKTILISPSSSSATSAASRIRPGKSRKASIGPPEPTGHADQDGRGARCCPLSMSVRRCIARSIVRCCSSTATTIRSSPRARGGREPNDGRRRIRDVRRRRP